MAKLLLIFLSLFLLTSCENKELSVSEEKIIPTSVASTIATPKEQEIDTIETKEELTPTVSKIDIKIDDETRELLNGTSIEKVEPIEMTESSQHHFISKHLFRFGKNILFKIPDKNIDFLDDYSNEKFQEYGFDRVYVYENTIFAFFIDKNKCELYVNKNDNMEKIYDFETKFNTDVHHCFILFADDKDVYLQYIENADEPEIISLVYDINSGSLNEASEKTIVIFETADRKVCMNINNQFRLEDHRGNTISAFYDDYLPVETPDNLSIDKFIFIMKDKFPLGEFLILNNDGSVFSSNKEFFDDCYNEDGQLDETYTYYEFYDYRIANTPNFCYMFTKTVPYPKEKPPNFSSRGLPQLQLLRKRSYFFSKKDGNMYYLTDNEGMYSFKHYLIGDSVKIFYMPEDINDEASKEISEKFADYTLEEHPIKLYKLSKDDDILFFISYQSQAIVLYDAEFNILEEIPYSDIPQGLYTSDFDKITKIFSSEGIEISIG